MASCHEMTTDDNAAARAATSAAETPDNMEPAGIA